MKRFLTRLAVFFLLFTILLLSSDAMISYEGSREALFIEKLQYFKKNKENFDTVFLGSSLTYRNINPLIFDSITGLDSYNFGRGALVGSEKKHILISMLNDGVFDGIKYLICESGFYYNNSRQRVSGEGIYFYTLKDYLLDLDFIFFSKTDFLSRLDDFLTITAHFLKSRIKIQAPAEIEHLSRRLRQGIKSSQGFFAIDDQFRRKVTKKRKRFLKDPEMYIKEQVDNMKMIDDARRKEQVPKSMLAIYNDLIELSHDRGVSLLFLFFPQNLSSEKSSEMYYTPAIISKLYSAHVIDLSDLTQMQELLLPEYYYDERHLNGKGAEIFTTYLADTIVKGGGKRNAK